MLGRLYLVVYNFVLAAGWGMVLHEMTQMLGPCPQEGGKALLPDLEDTVPVCVTGGPAKTLYWLKFFQTAAVLEVVHAAIGLVRSKPMTVLKQVSSRVVVLWYIIWVVPSTAEIPEYVLMLVAWSVTEVIRYSWYGLKELFGKAPFPLTWLRYTTFIFLYPLGVYGEQCVMYATFGVPDAIKDSVATCGAPAAQYLRHLHVVYHGSIVVFMLLYIPLFPGMYLHMFSQRKKALNPPRPKPTAGIQFPADRKGKVSTSATGQAVFAASILGVDPEAAVAVIKERNWRFGYEKHVIKNVELACRDAKTCTAIAEAGLAFMHNSFVFNRDGASMSLAEAMRSIKTSFPGTKTIRGEKPKPSKLELVVPYRPRPYPARSELKYLTGDALLAQLDKWSDAGTIEPSARDAIREIAGHPDWLDLSDRYFVLLGAGSAMGPYEILLAHGANIVAIDLDRPHIWKRLITMARESWGTIIFPLKVPESEITGDEELFANAGCNLFTETPEICNWISGLKPDKDFVIGGYAYLDGEAHVRVSLAMDAIMQGAIERRTTTTSLAYLCSPTDVFVRSMEAHRATEANLAKSSLVSAICGFARLFAKGICKPNLIAPVESSTGVKLSIVNGIVVPQGPNYALAKRLQHWRAMLSWAKDSPVSTNIAPSTATVSVVHNASFAAAYGGFKYFHPLEVAYQETSNAVMGALMLHDVTNPQSKAVPLADKTANPILLFAPGAFHGGIWRCGYTIGSIGEMSAALFYLTNNLFSLFLLASAGSAALAAYLGLFEVAPLQAALADLVQQAMDKAVQLSS